MSTFLMPSLGADMEAGTLVEWLVKPGAAVRHGDVIAVVETQKGAIEIEVFEDGIFEKSLAAIGDRLPVGAPMAVIVHPGEAAVEAPTPPVAVAAETIATAVAPPSVPQAMPVVSAAPGVAKRIPVTPAARQRAEQLGIALAELRGSGPRGEIVLADVDARKERGGAPQEGEAAPAGQTMTGMRAAIAAAMARSKREIPHYYLAHTAELTKAETWLAAYNAGRDAASRMLLGALFVKAVAVAAKGYPEFNGQYQNGAFAPASAVHAGVAINLRGGGLVAPAIHDADRLPLPDLMEKLKDLVARVRAGRFRGSELADPTITISSLGDRGVETLYGVIYPPQVAIVGFGTPATKAVVEDDHIVPRRVVSLSLAGDHRVSDGHRGALFLGTIADLLQRPEAL
ncbi:pyruvate dehydrogenase E2 component (dihydrolipoamide acetyltransferase) [Ciceribacter lividus]|uniref:Dihydrolipoamide acetyltransferase component of pyruvate dehydrogenase complex n=1 Tax=Ciceribacter lividus TaxID=1197950 RepID=A0A6I7HPQ8_9HYPH|nr:dihydrolipoamide acetyltransferase family protein [Ciceribacter lividus]RCW24146.1 pyruvate dehydrogenase E2 component (dihydrolipoamide acetyltransferase) [Ciceribacter lividus]